MFKLYSNVNRSGKSNPGSGGATVIPFNAESAFPSGEYVMFVSSEGMIRDPDAVMQYNWPESPRPIYAVFYTPREVSGHQLLCIDQIMVADSVQPITVEGVSEYAVLGHSRALYGSYLPVGPQCFAYRAKYEGISAMIARNSVLAPTYFLLKDGSPTSNMWTSPTFDMTKPADKGFGTITWSDGGSNTMPVSFARGPVGPMELMPEWFPYTFFDISRSRYPLALGSNGTSIYWKCWRPAVESEGVYSLQSEFFSQDTAEPQDTTLSTVAPLYILIGDGY